MSDGISPTPGLEPAGQSPMTPDSKPADQRTISVTPAEMLEPATQAPGTSPVPSSP